MATKVKGFYKGLKFISQIFVVKEREMDIGYPTDVKHVAHIGSDGPHGSAPGWMKEFKPGPDFSMPSLGSIGQKTPNSVATPVWSSHDFEKSIGPKPSCDMLNDLPPIGLPKVPRKQKQRKHRSASSPKCSSSSSRSSRAASKLKAKYTETEAAPNLHLLGQ